MSRVLVVEARFYEDISDALFEGAEAVLTRAGVQVERLSVPGALEIPGAIAMASATKRFDGFVALGCVIRGETTHYDIVAGESARAIMDLTVRDLLAIGNGILTVENEEQAWERARPQKLDKGGGAAQACLAMIEARARFAAAAS
ncbi:MAG TPA: 6,7-dimethyl-8-ribityllumazine synthase [Alphaproteobacteria bacterium]|nr:6,7-dimethyl-8-ribityllumazine synthase [Alphaproteobacteria bacterium]HAJ47474.1 6,7-dimethyl-8-ribityllumazine synthase [Alphaproteobacteria bacterium]